MSLFNAFTTYNVYRNGIHMVDTVLSVGVPEVFLNHLRTEQADNASLRRQNLSPAITETGKDFSVTRWSLERKTAFED